MPISAASETSDQTTFPTLKPRAGGLATCRMEQLGIELCVVAEQLSAADAHQNLRQLLGRARFSPRPRARNSGAIVGLDGSELGVGLRADQRTDAIPGGVRLGEDVVAGNHGL